jgi:hypothetical protein
MDLFIDSTARRFVLGPNTTAPLAGTTVFRQDETALRVYALRQTGQSASPLEFLDRTGANLRVAIGQIDGQPTSGNWTLGGTSLPHSTRRATCKAHCEPAPEMQA